ncbi:MAG: HAD family hydrolase [Treponema sp.]|nr:HAD family hydrolase [Treponema sp.]
MKHKCVIFDLDGTLSDTVAELTGAINRVLAADFPSLPGTTVEEIRAMQGKSLNTMLLRLFTRGIEDGYVSKNDVNDDVNDDFIEETVQKVTAAYDPRLYRAKPYRGTDALLGSLKQKKMKIAVLSNKPHQIARIEIRCLFPYFEFDEVRGVIPNEPYKPDPAAVLDMLAGLDAYPGNTMMVGDSVTDIKTALASECLPVGVSWGYFPAPLLKEAGARVIINRPEELLDLL